MTVRLSALRGGRPLPRGKFPVLISVRCWVDPGAILWLEGLSHLENPVTSSGIEPATFRLVAQCLNELRYRVSHSFYVLWSKELLCSAAMHAATVTVPYMKREPVRCILSRKYWSHLRSRKLFSVQCADLVHISQWPPSTGLVTHTAKYLCVLNMLKLCDESVLLRRYIFYTYFVISLWLERHVSVANSASIVS
jgi:hypothetical protein